MFGEVLEGDFENVAICARRNWQSALAIQQIERSVYKAHLQFAAFKNAAVLVAENWQKNLVAQVKLPRLPIDVEIRRVSRARAVFQDVHPPLIARVTDADMIRDKIQDLSHGVNVQLCDPCVVIG